jgi:hypothetical protein
VLRGGGLDEAPQAYRRLPEVLAGQAGPIDVEHTLPPLVVVMAGANEFDPYKDLLLKPRASLSPLLPVVVPAYSRKELAFALRRLCTDSALYWNAMPEEEFVAPLGGTWSPADHVRHLTKSVHAVARGLSMPRIVLRLLFPIRGRVSRRYDMLVKTYHEALRRGEQAGRFAPSPRAVPGDPEVYRREVLSTHQEAVNRLADLIMRWSKDQVDDIAMPHPLLGKLTVREMLMFTLYHNHHHVLVVARRREEYFSDATPLHAS